MRRDDAPAPNARSAARLGRPVRESKSEAGFTIVELLVSMAIIAILAALAIVNMNAAIQRAEIGRAIAEIRILEKEIAAYELDHDALPPDLAAIGRGQLRDPWGSPYQYLNFGDVSHGLPGRARKDKKLKPLNSTFDLYSMGPDRDSKSPLSARVSRDDIIRAADGAFVGRASDF